MLDILANRSGYLMFIKFQDLPNNMIHQVRIKSLPMEWLWCETWCDDYSKEKAKVIDLVRFFSLFSGQYLV